MKGMNEQGFTSARKEEDEGTLADEGNIHCRSTPHHRHRHRNRHCRVSSSFIDASRSSHDALIEEPSADASLMPSRRLSRKSNLVSFHPVSLPDDAKGTHDGSAIRDNRAPSAIRFIRTRTAECRELARYQSCIYR